MQQVFTPGVVSIKPTPAADTCTLWLQSAMVVTVAGATIQPGSSGAQIRIMPGILPGAVNDRYTSH